MAEVICLEDVVCQTSDLLVWVLGPRRAWWPNTYYEERIKQWRHWMWECELWKSKVAFLSNWHAPWSENDWLDHMWQRSSLCGLCMTLIQTLTCQQMHHCMAWEMLYFRFWWRNSILWHTHHVTSWTVRSTSGKGDFGPHVDMWAIQRLYVRHIIHTGHQLQTPSQSSWSTSDQCSRGWQMSHSVHHWGFITCHWDKTIE